MASKLFYIFIFSILFQHCLTASNDRVCRNIVDKSIESESDESNENQLNRVSLSKNENEFPMPKELTDADIAKYKQELSKTLTIEQTNQLDGILSKFKKGASTKDNVDGMVKLLIFAVAVRANASEIEMRNLFNEPLTTTTASTSSAATK